MNTTSQQIIKEGLQAASFINGIKRHNQTFLIVELIKKSISEQRQITRTDIVECYLSNKFPYQGATALGWYNDGFKWINSYISRERFIEFKASNGLESKAVSWFMNNLGAAIIKGKLLVIPVISIEESNCQGKLDSSTLLTPQPK